MSLVRIAARTAAVEALKGNTLVEANVLDSKIGAIDIGADGSVDIEEKKPFIAVYCDQAKSDGDNRLRAMNLNGDVEFLFEAGITAAMVETDPDTDESIVYEGIPATDDAFEFMLDIICRQIADALTDPANEWAEIFRRLTMSFGVVSRARTSNETGLKLAAHQIRIGASLIADPVRGTLKEGSPMALFLAKAEAAGGQLATRAAMMRDQLEGNEYDWQIAIRRYGMTVAEADALLLTTPHGAEADVAVVEVNTAPVEPVEPAQ